MASKNKFAALPTDEIDSGKKNGGKKRHGKATASKAVDFASDTKQESTVQTPGSERAALISSTASSDVESVLEYPSTESDDEEDHERVPATPTQALATPRALSPNPPSSPRSPASSSASTGKAKEQYTGADHDPNKKRKAILERTFWGLAMIGSFIAIVCLGQVYVIILVFFIQALVFSEITNLFDVGYSHQHSPEEIRSRAEREREARRRGRRLERDRWSRRMSWYFFATTNFFLYGETLVYYFKHILTLRATFLPTTINFAQHHRLVSFGLYTIGFVSFVANLTRASLRRQFGLFGWIHMSLFLIVVSSHFIVNNILEGLIWFWVPASLVIMNDIAAYACGMAFGRHQLIKLSPKKTVEGFVGAFFITILFAIGWGTFFMRFNYMVCPVQDLATNVLSGVQCTPNSAFVWREFMLPERVVSLVQSVTGQAITKIPWAPFQLHAVVMAVFASLVAPFGGFFASGFKRAFNIKDFGDSIPGHGGMTDRMDCQFLMGLFAYVYYASLVRENHITVNSVMGMIMTGLSRDEQLELLSELKRIVS